MRSSIARSIVVILVAAQIGLTWAALRGDAAGPGTPAVPIPPPSAPTEALTIETALPLTDPVALRWNPEATLIAASMEVVWPDDAEVAVPSELADDGAMTFVYAAGDHQFSLLMDRRSGVVFHTEVGEWSDVLASPLPVGAIARSSAIAVLAAEVSYGTGYRAACPQFRFVTRVYLSRAADDIGNPIWLVSYVDERHRDRPDIQISVDAVTGQTIGGQATSIGCADE